MVIVYESKAVSPIDPGYTGDCSGDSLRWSGQEHHQANSSSVSVAHQDTYAAPLSAASDTYTASLPATTNAGAFSHSSCRLPATDAVGRI
jgi:hypothetical protein